MNSRFTEANGKFSTRVSFSRITNALFRHYVGRLMLIRFSFLQNSRWNILELKLEREIIPSPFPKFDRNLFRNTNRKETFPSVRIIIFRDIKKQVLCISSRTYTVLKKHFDARLVKFLPAIARPKLNKWAERKKDGGSRWVKLIYREEGWRESFVVAQNWLSDRVRTAECEFNDVIKGMLAAIVQLFR